MRKVLAILEAPRTGNGMLLLQSALEYDCDLIFITDGLDKYDEAYGKDNLFRQLKPTQVCQVTSSSDPLVIVEALKQYPKIDGLVAILDRHVRVCAQIAELLSIPYLTRQCVELALDKHESRNLCEQAGVSVPRYCVVEDRQEAKALAQQWGFPVVLKASIGAGSQQVKFCASVDEFDVIYHTIAQLANDSGAQILLEEFVTGPLYSVETISYQGQLSFLGITNRRLGKLPSFAEIAAGFPAELGQSAQSQLFEATRKSLKAVGFDRGIGHTEFIFSHQGPVLVEINPRIGGGALGTLMSRALDVDIYEQIIRVALGEAPNIPQRKTCGAVFQFLYPESSGRLVDVRNVQVAKNYPGMINLTIKENAIGTIVGPAEDWRGNFGIAIATGENLGVAENNLYAALSTLIPVLEPCK
ncbi:MAG: ATP-grasp domain-containing protein [Algicola sp.]|nr:ATP-grasp domain-containing protein [Algicola sp.]